MAVARAALREGLQRLPVAELAGVELDIRLLVDHRERLVRLRSRSITCCSGICTTCGPTSRSRAARCLREVGPRIARPLARAEQTTRVRIARDELRRIRELTHTINALEAEIAELVTQVAPQLLAEPGFGPLTAGKLVGEIAGAQRFSSDAKLARAGGIAPIPVSSGKTNRHRLDRGGNRQINTAIHRIAVTRAAATPKPAPTSPANAAKARPPAKPSAASSATSHGASGTSCSHPTHPGPDATPSIS